MSDFAQTLTEDVRLTVLQLLAEADGYDLNSAILKRALADFGHRPSRDKLDTDLHWLAEQGLLTLSTTGGLVVARLTHRGADVASGAARAPGVRRPDP